MFNLLADGLKRQVHVLIRWHSCRNDRKAPHDRYYDVDQMLVQGPSRRFGIAFTQVIDNVLEYWKILDILVQN